MKTRIVQLIARFVGIAMTSVATFLVGSELSSDAQATIASLSEGLALASVAIIAFLVDLWLHRRLSKEKA